MVDFNMVADTNTETNHRKVIFDECANGFYLESRVAAVHRSCNYRSKITKTQNRSQVERCKEQVQLAETSKHLFDIKYEKEECQHYEHLRDNAAYKKVLSYVAKERAKNNVEELDQMGKYGPGATRNNLDILVQRQIEYMTPASKRIRRADKLLSKRKKENVFNRSINTPELFEMVKNRKSRSVSPVKQLSSEDVTKLNLPSIEAFLPNRFSNIPNVVKNQNDKHTDGSRGDVFLPAVFVTQKCYHNESN